jgi:uncharacterized protein
MIAGLVTLELHVPMAQGLKDKRAVVKRLVATLRRDVLVSVAEVDHQDLWQRCTLGIAVAAGSEVGVRKVVQQIEKVVSREHRVEIIALDVDVVSAER